MCLSKRRVKSASVCVTLWICISVSVLWTRFWIENCCFLKVPLTPKFFLSPQKSPFCSDHIGEKIIVVWFFLDFLWIFKIRKIRATVVHCRVRRRMGWVGLWHQPFRLERRNIGGHSWIVQLQRKKFTTMSYKCVAVNYRNVIDLAECILVHNIPFFGD